MIWRHSHKKKNKLNDMKKRLKAQKRPNIIQCFLIAYSCAKYEKKEEEEEIKRYRGLHKLLCLLSYFVQN